MPRSHPPTLITLARAALRERSLVPRGSRILVAVSGGPDSMALLHVLGLLRAPFAFGLFAHGVDHGLRPGTSRRAASSIRPSRPTPRSATTEAIASPIRPCRRAR